MKIALHVGAHCTDEGRLARTLARNRDDLLARRVSVPPPGNYKVLLREALHALDRGEPSAEAKEVLLDTILDATAGLRRELALPPATSRDRKSVV